MLFRFVLFLVFVSVLALANSVENPSVEGSPPPPPNGTELEPPRSNGTEQGPPPPFAANGTEIQENGNKTGGVINWIKSKIGK
ncbi:unnamed protein product [Caenorhabditis sp. 36 PRJEB53466]|nr:unnamed protein product [Caenorhabditis sp. 36 PRJEB53466]